MVAIIAKLPIQEDKIDQAKELFKDMLKNVSTEEGTLAYTINVSKKEPNTIVVMERYKDEAALGAHSSTPHFKEFSGKLGGVLAGKPEISILDEIGTIDR